MKKKLEETTELVSRIRSSDIEQKDRHKAFGRLVDRYQDMAFGTAFSILKDFHLAEDAAQNAFIFAYQDLSTLRDAAAFPGWLRRIVVNRCHHLLRIQKVPTLPLDVAVDVNSGTDPATEMEANEMRLLVRRAIAELPESQRIVTSLFYISGYSGAAIAELLQIPSATVRRRLMYARRKLKEGKLRMIGDVSGEYRPSKDGRFAASVMDDIAAINARLQEFTELTDDQFPHKTTSLRQRFSNGATLDELLPEAYGLVKEACLRMNGRSWEVDGENVTWNMIPNDAVLIRGIALQAGNITSVDTQESGVETGILPVYLHTLTGRGVHVVSVTDEHAKRSSEWMGPVYEFLGLSVEHLRAQDRDMKRKREAYRADVLFGVLSEYAFDQLRDGLATEQENQVDADYYYTLVEDAQSTLVEQANSPFIGASDDGKGGHKTLASMTTPDYLNLYEKVAGIVRTANLEPKNAFDRYQLNVLSIPFEKIEDN